MSDKVWLGAMYLKDEGGYEVVIKSLKHYKNRLRTIGNSPELKDAAAMFASVLNQQASKTIPKIDEMIQKIYASLYSIELVNHLKEDMSFLEKALQCHIADIDKAKTSGDKYFLKLVGNLDDSDDISDAIKVALEKIKQYS